MSKVRISAVLITFNEEKNLAQTLKRLAWCDEILVVDSGSTDQTVTLAESCGARVLYHPFQGFGAQKQYAVEQATHDWVLSIDADEWVSDTLASAIQRQIQQAQLVYSAFRIQRKTVYLGKTLKYGPSIGDSLVRLFNRKQAAFTADRVHEQVRVQEGQIGGLSGELLHFPYASVHQHMEKMNSYTSLAAQQARARGKHTVAWSIPFKAVIGFAKFYFLKLGFLDGYAGFSWAVFTAYYRYLKYTKLLELQRLEREAEGVMKL